jgi:release factor glutamine methyltransferase
MLTMTVRDAFRYAYDGIAGLRLRTRENIALGYDILQAALGVEPETLADDAALRPEQEAELRRLTRLCAHGMPFALAVGKTQFRGLELKVCEGAFVPRRGTEPVVDTVIELVGDCDAVRIVDLGAGVGAFAVSLAVSLSHARVAAVDLSPAAIKMVRENARRHGCDERVSAINLDIEGFVDEAWDGERFDAVVSNPPYVVSAEVERARWEPLAAFDGGDDGLDGIRLVARSARRLLKPGGWLVCCCPDREDALRAIFEDWKDFRTERLTGSLDRYFVARRAE